VSRVADLYTPNTKRIDYISWAKPLRGPKLIAQHFSLLQNKLGREVIILTNFKALAKSFNLLEIVECRLAACFAGDRPFILCRGLEFWSLSFFRGEADIQRAAFTEPDL
jgi:hypothetical protein